MLIGYARVSSTEQETTLQLDALRRAGVEVVHQEKRSAGPGLGSLTVPCKEVELIAPYRSF